MSVKFCNWCERNVDAKKENRHRYIHTNLLFRWTLAPSDSFLQTTL